MGAKYTKALVAACDDPCDDEACRTAFDLFDRVILSFHFFSFLFFSFLFFPFLFLKWVS